MNTEGLFQ